MKRYLFSTIILLVLFHSCSVQEQTEGTEKQQDNYIVLLDLSDRLLNDGQVEQDIELICHLFEKYELAVRNNLIINSKDEFRVVIAPQEKMSVKRSQSESLLYLDMSKINIAEKRVRLEEFKISLRGSLNKLYSEALLNKTKTSDFEGADIWKYFNDYLPGDIKDDCNNLLFVLSDGYFDFEPTSTRKIAGRKSTSSSFLKLVRGKSNWLEILEENEYGIIAIDKQFDALSICLMEVYPKYANLDETDMIQFVWEKWLSEMKIEKFNLIPHTSIPKMKGQIDRFLN